MEGLKFMPPRYSIWIGVGLGIRVKQLSKYAWILVINWTNNYFLLLYDSLSYISRIKLKSLFFLHFFFKTHMVLTNGVSSKPFMEVTEKWSRVSVHGFGFLVSHLCLALFIYFLKPNPHSVNYLINFKLIKLMKILL